MSHCASLLLALFLTPILAATELQVVATTGMIADLARAVGGDQVQVRALIGSGIDPHLYRPTRSDIQALNRAEVVLINGLHLEGRMGDVLARLGRGGKPVVAVAEAVPLARRLLDEDDTGAFDPHIWMDPSLWAEALEAVRVVLSQQRPQAAETFAANAVSYRAEMQALDDWARARLASIPAERRVLVTAHDAFAYFGRAYGVEVHGIQGLSTESEAGLADINRLVDLLVARGIGAVFVESSVTDRNVRALIEGAAARNHRVVIGGELFSDAMGTEGSYEGTWLGMIDHNVTTIVRALGGEVAEGGRLDRLGR